jgi:histidinol-phosphate/aromatic aminotransferase/cobyric acid decarboxylase-like protein
MMTTCRSCGTELAVETTKGRSMIYCGAACRRVAEHEVRRLDRALARLEDDARLARNPANPFSGLAEEARIAAEIARATDRMRVLLAD